MAKSRRAPSLVVRAPRHASRRVRPVLAAEIRRIARQPSASTIDLDDKHVVNDPTHPLGIASDNASEWNSLLITARAERGPQWDVATQRFMVDYGSHLYFDPAPLTFVKEPTPVPEEVTAAAGPSMGDPSASWQADPRFAHYNGGPVSGSGNMSNVSTPSRTSLRLQQQHQLQHPQHPHQSLNGYSNGIAMGSPYSYGLTNGRTPEQHHYAQAQAQAQMQMPHSYYDGSHSQAQSQHHSPAHTPHAMTNGIAIGGTGSPMMGRQMSMNSGIGMGMEYGGGPMGGGVPETPTLDARRRTRSQQDINMEIW